MKPRSLISLLRLLAAGIPAAVSAAALAARVPLVSLASPNVLVGAKAALGGFRPAILDHPTRWNVEELFWR